jgi:hypothetical protein
MALLLVANGELYAAMTLSRQRSDRLREGGLSGARDAGKNRDRVECENRVDACMQILARDRRQARYCRADVLELGGREVAKRIPIASVIRIVQ